MHGRLLVMRSAIEYCMHCIAWIVGCTYALLQCVTLAWSIGSLFSAVSYLAFVHMLGSWARDVNCYLTNRIVDIDASYSCQVMGFPIESAWYYIQIYQVIGDFVCQGYALLLPEAKASTRWAKLRSDVFKVASLWKMWPMRVALESSSKLHWQKLIPYWRMLFSRNEP